MKVIFNITHPAGVHFFKNSISKLEEQGNSTLIVTRNKDVTIELLNLYHFPYITASTIGKGFLGKVLELFIHTYHLTRAMREFCPDLIISNSSPFAAWAGYLRGVPHIAFDDTEHALIGHMLYVPITPVICSPSCYNRSLGKKQVRYAGFKELAYLHPEVFTPDPKIVESVGLSTKEKYFIIRQVSWEAEHDRGQSGFRGDDVKKLIELLSQHGKIVFTSERKQTLELLGNPSLIIPKTIIHHLLYFADMYIGEGGTMATEAALLGTPSIFVSTLKGGNWDELQNKYGLMFTCDNGQDALVKTTEWLSIPGIKTTWRERREKLLADKVNVTQWMVDFFNQYYQKSMDSY